MIETKNTRRVGSDTEGSSGGNDGETEMQPIHDGAMFSAPLEESNLGRNISPHENPGSTTIDGSQQCLEIVVQDPVVQPVRESLSLGALLDYVSVMSTLAFFCMIGVGCPELCHPRKLSWIPLYSSSVALRYLLEIGLGPTGALLTDDLTPVFRDIPANVLGCFLMGWVGVALKKQIVQFNDPLAVGLSTGLCGSLTTFAAWNQMVLQMVDKGLWVRGLSTYFFGALIAQGSLHIGIDSCTGFLHILERHQQKRDLNGRPRISFPRPDHVNRRWAVLMIFFTLSALMWTGAAAGTAVDTGSVTKMKLFLSVLVGPFGAWTRWYLSRLNGRGVGRKQHLKWLPVGTLITNLVAAWLEAALSAINRWDATPVGGLVISSLDLGMMGSMSTVSTFSVELKNLHQATSKQWRTYAYFIITICSAFIGGLLVYNVPVWAYDLPEYLVY